MKDLVLPSIDEQPPIHLDPAEPVGISTRTVEFLRSGDTAEPPPELVEKVPEGAQTRLKSAFHDLRFVWNAKRGSFMCVCREPAWRQTMYREGGVTLMCGWKLIPGEWLPPLDEETAVAQLRARAHAFEEMVAARGGNLDRMASDIADRYIEEECRRIDGAREAQYDEKMNTVLGLRGDGTVSPFGLFSGATISRPYARGPGAKEQARMEKRRVAALRGAGA